MTREHKYPRKELLFRNAEPHECRSRVRESSREVRMLKAERPYFVGNRLKTSVLIFFIFLCLLADVILPAQSSAQNDNPAQLESSKTIKLNPVPLDHVRLTGGPLKAAQDST